MGESEQLWRVARDGCRARDMEQGTEAARRHTAARATARTRTRDTPQAARPSVPVQRQSTLHSINSCRVCFSRTNTALPGQAEWSSSFHQLAAPMQSCTTSSGTTVYQAVYGSDR